MATSGDASTPVPTTSVSLPLVNTSGAVLPSAPPAGGPPTLASIAETLANLTTAIAGLQLQMMVVNNNLGDQAAHLSALDGRPAYLQFGLLGFGGVPALPARSEPVISEITTTASEPAASVSPSLPLPSQASQGALPAAPPSMGVPITQINFPRSPSPLPTFGSVHQRVPLPPTSHESSSRPYPHPPPELPHDSVPWYHKLKFETYDGKDNPLGWLNKCEQFFLGQLTREVDKVWLASYHLTGVTQQWFLVLESDIGRPSWPDFRRYTQQRFGPAIGVNHLADLARLPFGGSVDSYMEAF